MDRKKPIADGKGPLSSLSGECRRLFSVIRALGPVSKTDLRERTNIKLTTLNRQIDALLRKELILSAGSGDSTGGRKPALYDISPSRYLLVGIDLSRTYLQVILTDLKLRILDQKQTPMTEEMTPEKVVSTVVEMVREMMAVPSRHGMRILGTGIGAPGPIDRTEGVILNPRRFAAPGWVDVPIRRLLEGRLGFPAIMDIGVNAALTAEYLLGSGKGRKSLAFINCGVGIRSAFISEGKIVRTLNDREDAFGHMIIDFDGERCDCSNFGCIDCYSSIGAIVDNFKNAYKMGRATKVEKPLDEVDYPDICSAAEDGDDLSREILFDAATALGTGLSNYIKLLNPEYVIISGPLAKSSKLFFDTVVETARRRCRGLHEAPNEFERIGKLKDNAIALGASALCLESLLAEPAF